jgi:CHAD domain-containing protein
MEDMVPANGSEPAEETADTEARCLGIVNDCLKEVTAAADHARETDDADAIHNLRVAVRRLRAALGILRRASPSAELETANAQWRDFQQALGAAREWDVLIDQTIASMPKRPRLVRRMRPLVEAAEAQRAEAHGRARSALKNRKYAALAPRLKTELGHPSRTVAEDGATGAKHESVSRSEPFAAFAAGVLRRRHRKACKLAKDLSKLDGQGLHALRIRVKKLRYAAEFFEGVWPRRRTRRYLKRLAGLQQVLGDVHDAFVAADLVGKLEGGKTEGGPKAAEALRDWTAACIAHDRRQLARRWKKFEHRKRFWKTA